MRPDRIALLTRAIAISWLVVAIVLLLVASPTWAFTEAEAQQIVTATYLELLQRQPEPTALIAWSGFLLSGGTVVQFRQAVLDSSEYGTLQVQKPSVHNLALLGIPGLQATPVFNTGQFPCDGQHRILTAYNVSGGTVQIRMIRSWHGMDFGRFADFGSIITRLSDGAPVQPYPEDHYSQPIGSPLMDTLNFPEPGMRLPPGDGLILDYACVPQGQYDFIRGHVGVWVWWTVIP